MHVELSAELAYLCITDNNNMLYKPIKDYKF